MFSVISFSLQDSSLNRPPTLLFVMRLEVLTAVRMIFFRVVTPCRLVDKYRSCGETYCLSYVGVYLRVYTASQSTTTPTVDIFL
jgi:hypothetical protein